VYTYTKGGTWGAQIYEGNGTREGFDEIKSDHSRLLICLYQ